MNTDQHSKVFLCDIVCRKAGKSFWLHNMKAFLSFTATSAEFAFQCSPEDLNVWVISWCISFHEWSTVAKWFGFTRAHQSLLIPCNVLIDNIWSVLNTYLRANTWFGIPPSFSKGVCVSLNELIQLAPVSARPHQNKWCVPVWWWMVI